MRTPPDSKGLDMELKKSFWLRRILEKICVVTPFETSSNNRDTLTRWEEKRLLDKNNKERCPDCLAGLIPGPCGGASQNYKCEVCNAEFNLCFVKGMNERISDRKHTPMEVLRLLD